MSLAAGDLRARSMAGYEIVRRLAAGGMAEVHLARQVAGHMERLVVLKVPLSHLSDETSFIRMFRTEAALAAQLSHPNIVSIIDVADVDGMPCIVMEYLQGLDAREAMVRLGKSGRRVPAGIAAMIALGTALGLGYAHRKKTPDGKPLGIVHRDVSPHNIFLTRDGGVKLLDFGVAKSATQIEKTKTGVVKGKLAYLAPEQLSTSKIDGRADQWALGVVLWEMLAAKRLFRREGGEAIVLNAILNDPIPLPSAFGAPPELDPIVMRCLSRKPDARYPTCEALAADLQSFLRHTGARPETLALAEFVEDTEESQAATVRMAPVELPGEELQTISASASIPSGLVAYTSSSGFEIPELPLDAEASGSGSGSVDDEAGRVTHPTGPIGGRALLTVSGPTPLTGTPSFTPPSTRSTSGPMIAPPLGALRTLPPAPVARRGSMLLPLGITVALLAIAAALVIVARWTVRADPSVAPPAATPTLGSEALENAPPPTVAPTPARPGDPASNGPAIPEPSIDPAPSVEPSRSSSRDRGSSRSRPNAAGASSTTAPPIAPVPSTTVPPVRSGGSRERPTTGRDIDRAYP